MISWNSVANDLFLRALEVSGPADRRKFLDRECAADPALRADVEALLAAHERAVARDWPPRPADLNTATHNAWPGEGTDTPPDVGPDAGRVVAGRYRLLRMLGEGGMGTVWLAEQIEPVRRQVALKLIRPGMDSERVAARFEAERQALALMDHTNIAKVFDAGATPAGRPYFAMELIQGVPITRYCDELHLSIRERLGLFVDVCRAVQHAHQKGVIHRDIKPTNVLVAILGDTPVPKVIDFGVAKALTAKLGERTLHTEAGQVVGTLEYMAPEQAELSAVDIDTRADVYALGALLYELLTGTTPLAHAGLKKVSPVEALRRVREEEPPRPSTRLGNSGDTIAELATNRRIDPKRLPKEVRRELDWVVMKCLEKDRDRRYETANALAMEAQRYLADVPVLARPPSVGYRFRKFASRNKRVLATMTLLSLMPLAAGTVLFWQDRRWTDQTLRAEVQARKTLERSLYFQSIARAHLEWGNNDVGRADEILESCPAEYRHWEWHYLKRLCHGELFTLRGDVGCLHVAFSPDGRRLASSCQDGSIKVWDLATGQAVLELRGHEQRVNRIAFSPDGERLVSAGGDWATGRPGELKIWDFKSGSVRSDLAGHAGEVTGVAYSPDGRTLVSGGMDRRLVFWDASTGKAIRTIRNAHTRGVKSVAFAPDGTRVATGGWGSGKDNLKIWDAASAGVIQSLPYHAGDVIGVAFSPDGKRLVSVGWDQTVAHWDLTAGRLLHQLNGHASTVCMAEFSPDGKTVATASSDGSVKLWDSATGREVATLRGHTHQVSGVAFSPGGRCLATAGWDRSVKVWDLTPGGQWRPFRTVSDSMALHRGPLAYSPDGQLIALATGPPARNSRREEPLRTWWAESGRPTSLQVRQPGGFHGLAYCPDGSHIAADCRSAVVIRDARTGRETRALTGHADQVTAVAYSRDGRRLFSGSDDRTLRCWDPTTGQALATFSGHTGGVTGVAVHADGRLVASAGRDGTVRVWDAADGGVVWTFTDHTGPVNTVAFSPDGRRLASGGDDRTVCVWDVRDGRAVLKVSGHLGPVTGVTYTPDGLRLVSTSPDGSVRLWDALTGQEALTLRTHSRELHRVVISPDGRRIVSGAASNDVTFWENAGVHPGGRENKVLAWHRLEAEGYESRGRWQAAVSHWDRLVEAKPGDVANWEGRARCDLQLRKWEQGVADLTRAIELRPDDPILWGSRAWCRLHRGDWERALTDFTKGTDLKADYWEGWLGRARCAAKLNRWEQAINAYEQTIRVKSDVAMAHNNLAHLLATCPDASLRNSAKAVEHGERAIELGPKDGDCWNTLAAAYYRAGQWQAALKALEQATGLRKGGDGTDWFLVAMTHWQLGNKDEAREWYHKAVAWMETNNSCGDGLRRIRAEAEELLTKSSGARFGPNAPKQNMEVPGGDRPPEPAPPPRPRG